MGVEQQSSRSRIAVVSTAEDCRKKRVFVKTPVERENCGDAVKKNRIASEEVILHLVKTKCLPILLYRLECYSLNKADTRSLDFAVTRFLMKMFRTVNMDVINDCRSYFDSMLPSELLVKRKSNFLRKFDS